MVNECNDSDYKNNKAGCVTGSRDHVVGMDLKHTVKVHYMQGGSPEGKVHDMQHDIHLEDRSLT